MTARIPGQTFTASDADAATFPLNTPVLVTNIYDALAKAGAIAVHGVEIVAAHVAVGNKLRGDLPITFEVGDANVWRPRRHYDVIAMLALLQKVKDPTRVCAEIVEFAREMVVLRLPPKHAPTIIDDRSGNQPHHIGETMKRAGFYLEHAGYEGAFGEWVGNYRRVK